MRRSEREWVCMRERMQRKQRQRQMHYNVCVRETASPPSSVPLKTMPMPASGGLPRSAPDDASPSAACSELEARVSVRVREQESNRERAYVWQ